MFTVTSHGAASASVLRHCASAWDKSHDIIAGYHTHDSAGIMMLRLEYKLHYYNLNWKHPEENAAKLEKQFKFKFACLESCVLRL